MARADPRLQQQFRREKSSCDFSLNEIKILLALIDDLHDKVAYGSEDERVQAFTYLEFLYPDIYVNVDDYFSQVDEDIAEVIEDDLFTLKNKLEKLEKEKEKVHE